ncbi:hypothetical protein ACVR0Q_04510 [Streptococcus canis]|uniref:hypothetical protein n=1 Tax=Streptococcus canis TaxID=1329 RepID=UPI002F96BB30
MSESFDYVAFARDFEKRHGRPPTAEELEQGIDPWEGAEIERINASYKPSLWERLKTGLSFVTRNFFRALLIVIQTPVYLTLFFFNLIKSAFAAVIMCIITKAVFGVIIAEIFDSQNIDNLSQAPKLLGFFAQDFMTNNLEPIYFTEIDIIICIIFSVFLALVMTFSKSEV